MAVLAEDEALQIGQVTAVLSRNKRAPATHRLQMYTEGPDGVWTIDTSRQLRDVHVTQLMSIMQVDGQQPEMFCLEHKATEVCVHAPPPPRNSLMP